jgi:DNA-binding transcriptional LysR family regulator
MFVNVVARGGFSAASRYMGIPVATVSRRVAELESSLNVRLLERSTRKLRLTEEGEILYQFASRGVEELDAGLLALSEKDNELRGRLRLSMPPGFEPMWGLIDGFQKKYANVEIELYVSERRMDFIADGIDLALRIGEVGSLSAVTRLLSTYRHRLVASPEFLNGIKIQSPDDIADVKCAAWGPKYGDIVWTLGGASLRIHPVLRVNDYLHLRHLALDGKYLTELPPFLAESSVKSGELIEVLPGYTMPEQKVNLVYPNPKSVSRINRLFIDYCAANFPDFK